jgi:hypothetical protein
MLRLPVYVRENPKPLFGLRRCEICGHRVEGFVADLTPVDAWRFLVIPPVNIGETFGIAGLDDVQHVIRLGRLENATHPLPAFYRVAGKVEDDRDIEAQ